MISNAISEGSSFAFDSSCFEKWTTLMGCCRIHQRTHLSHTHTYSYKAVVVTFSDRSLRAVIPQTDRSMKDSAEELLLIS